MRWAQPARSLELDQEHDPEQAQKPGGAKASNSDVH